MMNPSLLPQDFEDACVDDDACLDSGARAPTHHPYDPGDHSSRNAPPPSTTVPKTLASATLSLRGSGASLGAGAIKLLGVAYTGAGAVSRVPAADSELHAPKSSGGFTTPPSICLLPATAVAHPSFDAIMGEGEQLMSCIGMPRGAQFQAGSRFPRVITNERSVVVKKSRRLGGHPQPKQLFLSPRAIAGALGTHRSWPTLCCGSAS